MELDTAVRGYMKQRERVHKEDIWNDIEKLSDAAIRTTLYYGYIGDHVARLHKIATDKNYKIFLEERAKGSAVNAAEKKAHGESTAERRDYENVLVVRKSIELMVSNIQTRLRILEGQASSKY